MMRSFGRSSVSDFLGDRIVYRNLNPVDAELPGCRAIQQALGLPAGAAPRKTGLEYARVVVELLRRAQALEGRRVPLRRVLFVGDTLLNDQTAFANICQAGDWAGAAFICAQTRQPAEARISRTASGQPVYLANRWEALEAFEGFCRSQGLPVDEATAVLVDLDKTAIGARGRNDRLIDQARVEALEQVCAGLLGEDFDLSLLQAAYEQLRAADFHPLTEDNQDYLAYLCLAIAGGGEDLARLVGDFREGRLASFGAFIARMEARRQRWDARLRPVHDQVYANVRAGDPTPFKPFRHAEYRATIRRMGCLDDEAPVEAMLANEIVITQEVRLCAERWRGRGALLFGLSDKPDEASLPTPELAAQGWLPVHRQPTHGVGEGDAGVWGAGEGGAGEGGAGEGGADVTGAGSLSGPAN
jgi:hypothetical protein